MLIQCRDYDILSWLNHMSFLHRNHVKRAFFKKECNPDRAPYRRLLKLMEAGLVETTKVYSDPRDLYVPTHAAVTLLRSIGFQYVPALPKDKRFKHYDHDKGLIKLRILAKEIGLGLWVPERVIRSVKPRGSCPDALLITVDGNYAIEYELYPKEPYERYKKIFERCDENKNYDGVLYILPSESRIEKLKEKMGYIQKKIYFISEEKLFRGRENAVFYSSCDGLTVKCLIDCSLKCPLEEFDRKDLKAIVQSESSMYPNEKNQNDQEATL